MPKILALGGGSATGTVTAPVALTANVIPKASGAATLTNSSLTDNGTTVTSSKPIVVPTGSGANNLGGLQFASGVALYENGTTLAAWDNDIGLPTWGMGEDASFVVPAAATTSAGIIGWTNSASSVSTVLTDTAFSRLGAASVALGNGSSGSFSGTLKLTTLNLAGLMTNYNGNLLVENGVPSAVGDVSLTRSSAVSATTLFTPVSTGFFRVSMYLKVTTVGSVSSVLGGTTGVTITYKDGADSTNQSIVMALQTKAGAIAISSSGNSTTTLLTGSLFINALAGTAIQYAIDYTSVNANEMAYEIRAVCEAL